MDNYNEIYYYLFNRITDLIEEMKSIQQFAEEMFITYENTENANSNLLYKNSI